MFEFFALSCSCPSYQIVAMVKIGIILILGLLLFFLERRLIKKHWRKKGLIAPLVLLALLPFQKVAAQAQIINPPDDLWPGGCGCPTLWEEFSAGYFSIIPIIILSLGVFVVINVIFYSWQLVHNAILRRNRSK